MHFIQEWNGWSEINVKVESFKFQNWKKIDDLSILKGRNKTNFIIATLKLKMKRRERRWRDGGEDSSTFKLWNIVLMTDWP